MAYFTTGSLVSDTKIIVKDKITIYFLSKKEEKEQNRKDTERGLPHPTVYYDLLKCAKTTPETFKIVFEDVNHTT